jgi:hypothetical protein
VLQTSSVKKKAQFDTSREVLAKFNRFDSLKVCFVLFDQMHMKEAHTTDIYAQFIVATKRLPLSNEFKL